MRKFASAVATATLVSSLLSAGALPASAQQQNTTSPHSYTCSNQGGGPNHTVNCSGLITVNNVLNGTQVNVGDINVLSGNQLDTLELALVKAADNSVNLPVTLQVANLEKTAINTYLTKFGIAVLPVKVEICAGSICV
ncbi:preprotein translocase subunit TatB [Streptomyces lavendulocolor]|uniref:preprotein translocase subunit TatB n=1 Tax=Streptomyces lavendulocolor TaxID=67316 RepID=UPI00340DF48D